MNKHTRRGKNYELTTTFQSCHDALPSVILGNPILIWLLVWVVYHREATYTVYSFFIKFLLTAHSILKIQTLQTNTNSSRLSWQYFCIVTQKPKFRCHSCTTQLSGVTLISVAFKNESPWKQLLWLLHATSCVCKRHCLVVKNHTFSDSNHTSTIH